MSGVFIATGSGEARGLAILGDGGGSEGSEG